MINKIFLLVAFTFWGAQASLAQVTQQQKAAATKTVAPKVHRIIYDMSAADTAQQAGLIRQLNNVKRGWPTAQIEVVVHGKALDMLVQEKSTRAAAIKDLQGKGVVFSACENTMNARKVTKEQLLPQVPIVPMGIGELIMKQEEGWGYIKF